MAPMNLERNSVVTQRDREGRLLVQPVVEIFHVDKESQVDEEPEDEGLS